MAATAILARQIGALATKGGGGWYGPHMAAASRAIAERLPLVDLVLEIRDARIVAHQTILQKIPLSSEYEQLRNYPSSSRRIIVMNKMDLANRSQIKEWKRYFEQQNCISYGVNSHNKENIKELLNFLLARVRELKRTNDFNYTAVIMLIGIPNVVHDVRRTLFETISSFDGNVQVGEDLSRLIEAELTALREAFQVPVELGEEAQNKVAAKLLNLYRTGRLGHYTLDSLPWHT
ncbi:dar gtpase 2 [Quercus suber]|uniref:Dar gtpase 2 n=1 Tax=Quercus suber TaxID=58331 RepID=A0AAW0L3A9_QUESU